MKGEQAPKTVVVRTRAGFFENGTRFCWFSSVPPSPGATASKWVTSNWGMSARCLVFSLSGLSPLTQLDHQNTSETHQRSAYLNRRALKNQNRPRSLFRLRPSSSSMADQTPRTRRFSFHQRSLQQTGQAFPVGGTWGEEAFLGQAPLLPVSANNTLSGPVLILYYTTLIHRSSSWEGGLKFQDCHCCV